MQNPDRHGVIGVRPEQPSRSYTGTLYEEREECGEFVTFGRGRRGERRYGMQALPLSPNLIGIWRHVGNSPVHVPETGIAGRFVQQAHNYEIGIADALWRNFVRRGEGFKARAHPGTALQYLRPMTRFADQ